MKAFNLSAVALIWLTLIPTDANGESSEIILWTRKSANYEGVQNPDKLNVKTVDLRKLNKVAVDLFDVQYGKRLRYQGLWLDSILDKYQARKDSDMIILHFKNGMLIPILETKSPIFIALEKRSLDGKWESSFDEVKEQSLVFKTPLPTKFSTNKLVVSKLYGPKGDGSTVSKDGFSPWRYIDSLIGIEFVRKNAYYKQFEFASDATVSAGQKVFMNRCQFCHGVKKIGASFGWDFVTPIAIYEKRKAEDLYYHVKFPKAKNSYFSTGMPNQKHFTQKDADDLWQWMKAAAKKAAPAYL